MVIFMDRTVLHSDLNAFYASVECFLNPRIRNLPVAVGGDQDARHGIILAKNQLAKSHGVSTGEAIWQAKQKCRELVVVPAHFERYLKFSKLVKEIYREYTDQTESFGIDESWLDVTGSVGLFGGGEAIAEEIRSRVYSELGLTVSIGVSFNKIFAKLGSDMKKPDAVTVISRENYKNVVWRLPASNLLYVGRSTTKKLRNYGINTIGDIAQCDVKYLYSWLGKWGLVLHRFANGEDYSPVEKNGAESYIKSVGNSTTTPRDLTTIKEVKAVFYMLADSVAARLREQGLKCTTVQIYIRDKNLLSCERQAKLDYPSFISGELAEKALEIFMTKYQFKQPLRTIGIRGTNLVQKDTTVQLDLFTDFEKREKLEVFEHTVDQIRSRFGYNAIKKGILLADKSLTHLNAKEDNVIHPINYFDGEIL